MNFKMSRSAISVTALVLLGVLFFSLNLFSNTVFRSAQIDLTENSRFTLSDGSRRILAGLEEPITLRFFYSEGLTADYPRIRTFAGRVRDLLEELRDEADGNIVLEVIDPEPFSRDEDRVMGLGLKGAPTTEGEVIYFGLAGSNLVDGLEVVPFFTEEREEYLEYDLVRLISALSAPDKPRLGVVTNLPLDTGAGGLMAAMRGQSQSFMIYEELRGRFEIEFLEQDFVSVPSSVDVLMIAHPKPLNDRTLYAVDQFVMRGGRVLAFIDPHSEVSLTAGPDGRPVQGYTETSDLGPLMAAWGVSMDPDMVIGDRGRAQRVRAGLDVRRQLADYIIWLAVKSEDMNQDDVVTADIDQLNLGTVGALEPVAGATTTFLPLVRSSADSSLLELDYVKTGPTPDALLRGFEPTDGSYVISARLSGTVRSAFPDGPPPAPEDQEVAPGEEQDPEAHLRETEGAANIILFADSEIFDDRFWVQTQNYQGQRVAAPIADNAKFVLSAVENLMGSNDLISLRAREKAHRPFVAVETLRRDAEARFLAEQEALQAKISDTEARLADLQAQAGQLSAGGRALMSAEQAAEITRFRTVLAESRAALREVQRRLRSDIDRLGNWVRFINVLAMPLFLSVIAIGVLVVRQRKRAARALVARARGVR